MQSSAVRREHDAAAVEYRWKRDIETARVNHQRNQQAPIIQLPVEVFTIILFTSLPWMPADTIQCLRELASVAKHWWDVISSAPQLWAFVSDTLSIVEVEWVLRRSKDVPLEVVFSSYEEDSWEFSTAISAHASRWRTLQILHIHVDAVAFSLRSKARLLEEFMIIDDHYKIPKDYRLELCEPWRTSRL